MAAAFASDSTRQDTYQDRRVAWGAVMETPLGGVGGGPRHRSDDGEPPAPGLGRSHSARSAQTGSTATARSRNRHGIHRFPILKCGSGAAVRSARDSRNRLGRVDHRQGALAFPAQSVVGRRWPSQLPDQPSQVAGTHPTRFGVMSEA